MDDLVIQTVLRNFLTKLITAALVWAGAFLLSHGIATEDQVKQLVDPLAQIIVGAALSLGGVVAIYVRAKMKRTKETRLLAARPAAVEVKGS